MTIVTNVILFQAAWFAGVLGAAQGLYWIGVVAAVLVGGWHVVRSRRRLPELALLLLALAVGAVFETILVQAGLLHFDGGSIVAGTAPAWMIALWANFATTLNVSLRLLRERPVVAAIFGAIGAPLAYFAGAKLGAVDFIHTSAALAAIAAGWALLAPLLFYAARRLDGYAPK